MSESTKSSISPSIGKRIQSISLCLIVTVIGVVSFDQYTKQLVEKSLSVGEMIPVIDGFFHLTLHYNKGAAFGMFHDLPDGMRQVVLWGVSSVALFAVLYFLIFEYYNSRWGRLSLSLILGGAVGNAIDRALKGKVVDFLDFAIGSYHWPAFNVADSAITVGAAVLVILTLFQAKKES